jgi:hypothetical protein
MRGCIPKLFLVRATTKVARNDVEDVKFIITTTVCSVFVVVWHCECHQVVKEIRKQREEQDRIIRTVEGI